MTDHRPNWRSARRRIIGSSCYRSTGNRRSVVSTGIWWDIYGHRPRYEICTGDFLAYATQRDQWFCHPQQGSPPSKQLKQAHHGNTTIYFYWQFNPFCHHPVQLQAFRTFLLPSIKYDYERYHALHPMIYPECKIGQGNANAYFERFSMLSPRHWRKILSSGWVFLLVYLYVAYPQIQMNRNFIKGVGLSMDPLILKFHRLWRVEKVYICKRFLRSNGSWMHG